MSTQTDFIRILQSPTATGISFRLPHVYFHGSEFLGVACDISIGSIPVVETQIIGQGSAVYIPGHSTIATGPGPVDDEIAVREAARAICHTRYKFLHSLDAGLVAYVAQLAYEIRQTAATGREYDVTFMAPGKRHRQHSLTAVNKTIVRRLLQKIHLSHSDIHTLRLTVELGNWRERTDVWVWEQLVHQEKLKAAGPQPIPHLRTR